MLEQRKVLLAVSGGVAAYKAAYLARRLQDAGAVVRVVMTSSAAEFLGPQTMAAITGEQPIVELFGHVDPSPHTNLAAWADLVVVAPATAATIARIATGLSDDAVSATVLAAWGKPLFVAPAMHTEMYDHPGVQRNLAALRADGVVVIGPAHGHLAGGDEGPGRLEEPETIVAAVESELARAADLADTVVLITSGGTREAIDPVRYIGNRSSGKMGNAIALAAAARGASVILVTTTAAPTAPGIEIVPVETAQEMAEAAWRHAESADIAIMAAAVADFRPAAAADRKLKRSEGTPVIDLEPTPDVLGGISAMERRPFLVGFAAETGSLDDAVDKAHRKNVDLLVANDVAKEGSGFGTDTNQVTLITGGGESEPWELMSKREVADRLFDRIIEMRRSGS